MNDISKKKNSIQLGAREGAETNALERVAPMKTDHAGLHNLEDVVSVLELDISVVVFDLAVLDLDVHSKAHGVQDFQSVVISEGRVVTAERDFYPDASNHINLALDGVQVGLLVNGLDEIGDLGDGFLDEDHQRIQAKTVMKRLVLKDSISSYRSKSDLKASPVTSKSGVLVGQPANLVDEIVVL
ncbi:hypothetical protein RHMOL_Rhmol03G0126600 [Rhododendron molle]|uniref:Uncharacterized protein n=1 Tax=Rhododendron molle TaxID=49168 RepID=A0ACC0PG73_RHOML|nr:hypothetical protein RHMOL_Rhmol03G0126600 [Rhododendron molle]